MAGSFGACDPTARPTVSPDGRFVIYNVAEEGELREQLRVRGLDGRGDRPLLGHGDAVHAVWN